MTVIDDPKVTPPQIIEVPLIFGAYEIDGLDIEDVTIASDSCERIDLGGSGALLGSTLRVEANDLVAVADALRRLADRISTATFDARDEKLDAERHDCFCRVRLERDEVTCGSAVCDAKAAAEAWADAHSERF